MNSVKILLWMGVLGSTQAWASSPLLRYTFNNGSIEPTHRVTRECTIYADTVTKKIRGAGYRASPVETEVLWNKSTVKDLPALKALVQAAKKGKIEKNGKIAPSGSGMEQYLGYYDSRSGGSLGGAVVHNAVVIRSQAPGTTYWFERNTSSAAKTLKTFIDANCK